MAPSWMTIENVFQKGSARSRPSSAWLIRRCAVELTGRNSVSPSTMPSSSARRYSFMSHHHVFAAVDADGVAGDPRGVGVREDHEGLGHVARRGETARRVAALGALLERLVAGNLLGRPGGGDAGPDR